MHGKKPVRLVIVISALIAVLGCSILGKTFLSQALFDSSQAVHIDPDAIENSTLIIGTHLIHLSALNDTNYAIAKKSASDANQNKMYYKSELSSGMWYCIDDAGSVKDITTEGMIVEKDEIKNLPMTHHTKSDGITYDLRSNQAVCIFNIEDLTDTYNMEELDPIKNQNNLLKEAKKQSDADKEHIKMIAEFYGAGFPEDFNKDYNEKIDALQIYYEQLVSNKAPAEESANVMKIMEKLSNARKVSTYELIEGRVDVLSQKVVGKKVFYDFQDPDEDDYEPNEEITLNDALMSAIADAKSAVSETKLDAQSNMIEEGSNVITSKEYQLMMDMVNSAKAKNYSACDVANAKLIDLDHIQAAKIAKKESELSLTSELITEADTAYRNSLSVGVTENYKQLSDRNMTHAALENCIKQDMDIVNAARSEMQFLIQARIDRLENQQAQEYIKNRIGTVVDFRRNIKADAYKDAANATVDQYNEWLMSLLNDVKKSSDEKTSTDSLYEKKEAMLEEKQKAIDNLDLDLVKKIDAQLEVIDEQINAIEAAKEAEMAAFLDQKNRLEEQLANINNESIDSQNGSKPGDSQDNNNSYYAGMSEESMMVSLDAINAKLAEMNADASDTSQAANINAIKGEINDLIRGGDTSNTALDTIKDGVEGLKGALDNGSSMALAALNEILNTIDKSDHKDAYKKIADDIRKMISGVDQDSLDQKRGGGSAEKTEEIVNNKGKLIDALDSGSTDASTMKEIEETIDNLAKAMEEGSGIALNALNDAYQDMVEKKLIDNKEEYNDLIEKLEEIIAEAPETAIASDMNEKQCEKALNEALEKVQVEVNKDGSVTLNGVDTAEGLNEAEAAVLAVADYAKLTKNKKLADMANGMALQLDKLPKKYIYKTFETLRGKYAPVDVVGKFTNYKYLWNDTKKSATLSRGAKYYEFTAFSREVILPEGQKEKMDEEAQFYAKSVYIEASYLEKTFGAYIMDIYGTDYSVLVNDKVVERSQELSSELLEKGGV